MKALSVRCQMGLSRHVAVPQPLHLTDVTILHAQAKMQFDTHCTRSSLHGFAKQHHVHTDVVPFSRHTRADTQQ